MPGEAVATLCERIVASMPEAVIFADREGVIRLWNPGAESLFGYAGPEAVGQSLDILIPDDLRSRHWEGYRAAIVAGRTRLAARALPTRAVRKGGETFYVELSFAIIRGEGGAAIGALAVGRDITERRAKDRARRQRLADLEAALAGQAPPGDPAGPA
jgi:PAS domain S-box-containing protein